MYIIMKTIVSLTIKKHFYTTFINIRRHGDFYSRFAR